MYSAVYFVASLTLLAVCACAPADADVIQRIPPKPEPTPSATGKDVAVSGALERAAGSSDAVKDRLRRELVGQESDLLPSLGDIDASPFGENSQLSGRSRIKVLPAFLG